MALQLFPSPIPPPAGLRRSFIKRPTSIASVRASAPFQIKSNKVQIPQAEKNTVNVSRRDIMQFAATNALVGIALFFTKPAEARASRFENKKKAMEKIEKLREKSGISKPKAEAPPTPGE